ncbi:hypothetical protein AMTR_s00006p00262010 [Amborella trichopoda]|uniref:Uncharacterized protein n=1 Tax=Amborella trichopoda TaxID=13333 RepID=W1PDQ6_AMBTC|nr:hypothetical protein AMTR_s00006p00262010 [Amborella trichopoda]
MQPSHQLVSGLAVAILPCEVKVPEQCTANIEMKIFGFIECSAKVLGQYSGSGRVFENRVSQGIRVLAKTSYSSNTDSTKNQSSWAVGLIPSNLIYPTVNFREEKGRLGT